MQRDRASALALRGRRGELPGRRAHHSYQHHHATGAVLDRPGPINHAATAKLQCAPTLAPVVPPAVAAVPTLHGALLALLGAALAVFGWRQRPA